MAVLLISVFGAVADQVAEDRRQKTDAIAPRAYAFCRARKMLGKKQADQSVNLPNTPATAPVKGQHRCHKVHLLFI